MIVVELNPEKEQEVDKEPPMPRLTASWRGNPLEHLTSFTQGDAIRATSKAYGLEPGREYAILGWWHRQPTTPKEGPAMYVYLENSANGYAKHFRSAVEEEKTHEEVLFACLPDEITEICLTDHLQRGRRHPRHSGLEGLEYVPAMAPEVIMKREYGGLHEDKNDHVIPLHDKTGQFLLFSISA